MSRILIYDSQAQQTQSGVSLVGTNYRQDLVVNTWRRSLPVRLFGGPEGDQRNVSYEFVLFGEIYTAVTFEWYQEFFPDSPWIDVPSAPMQIARATGNIPDERICPASQPDWTWAREQISEVGDSGAITHYNITRTVAMTVPGTGQCDSRWFPMLVHAIWGRLAIRTTTAGPYPRLQIHAHVGGCDDIGHYTERGEYPFDYVIPDEE